MTKSIQDTIIVPNLLSNNTLDLVSATVSALNTELAHFFTWTTANSAKQRSSTYEELKDFLDFRRQCIQYFTVNYTLMGEDMTLQAQTDELVGHLQNVICADCDKLIKGFL
jgi:hypothetical protein